MESDVPNIRQPGEGGKREDELQKLLSKYPASADNVYLLILHLYEVLEGCRKYVDYFETLFTLPADRKQEQDQLLDILIEIKVLLEDMEYHSTELRARIDEFADTVEPDP